MSQPGKPSYSSVEYSEEYFHDCEGYDLYTKSHGLNISRRLKLPLDYAELKRGMKVVDIGCGRGEVLIQAGLCDVEIIGVDYSKSAVSMSQKSIIKNLPPQKRSRVSILQGDAFNLPVMSSSVDRVFMLDIVEHLTKEERRSTLLEAYRILVPGGKIIIHTMPNLWYYRFGYPIFRIFQKIRGISLPADPHDRGEYLHLHINEQTILSLFSALSSAKFHPKVWLENTQGFDRSDYKGIEKYLIFLVTVYPFRWVFCNDIFAIGTR